MDIEVWSVGKAKFTADPEYQEPAIREAIDQRGDVADAVLDYTDSERSDISYDEYARVTGDLPGLVLFEGWLTGDRGAPPPVTVKRESAAFIDAADYERKRVIALTKLVEEMADDIEQLIGGRPGYIDRDMLDGYRDRAGLEQS